MLRQDVATMSLTNACRVWSLGMVLSLCSCAHVERVGFDNPTRTVRYCGNKHADEQDVKAKARKECSSVQRLDVVRCMREQIGAEGTMFNNQAGASLATVEATYGVCCDFRCGA